ncbi:hypothetical protein NFI96_024645 [Prochilodus magdalenae]|nr:hypothetical protein NFI96_024645 [Prochilodus magdalenae]
MESVHRERSESGGNRLGVSAFQRHLSTGQPLALPDLCSNSSLCKISDETLPYMSGIFDDTIDPSFTSEDPATSVDHHDRSQLRTLSKSQATVISELRSQTKAAYSSWLITPVKNGHSIDFSMSITSPQNEQEEVANVTETSSKDGTQDISSHIPVSTSCSEIGDMKVESQNNTFDMTKDLKEKSSELNSTITSVRTESNNATFEKTQDVKETFAPVLGPFVTTNNASLQTVHEKHLNSTVDICSPSSTSTEQPNEKLDHTVDISRSQSNVSKREPTNEGLASGEDCEKHGTFIKTPEEAPEETPEEATVGLTGDGEQNGCASIHVSTEAGEPSLSQANPKPFDRTFTKPNTTTDLAPAVPVSNFKNDDLNTTLNMTKPPDTQLPAPSKADSSATVDDASSTGPISTGPVVTGNAEVVVCSNRTLDLPDAKGKEEEEEKQGMLKRRNGVSEQDCCVSLDLSHSSMFSLDDTIEMKSRALVTSTPIVLGRGFDRLSCVKPMDMQKRLSVINSIDAQSNDDLVGVGEHDGSDPSDSKSSSIKSEICQTRKDLTKCTSNSTTSELAVVNKPPSKLAVRRKIPQPSCKSSIPKTQIPPRPPITQAPPTVAKPKTVLAAQAPNQSETSTSTLRSTKRTVLLNKGKSIAPTKNTLTAGSAKTSSVATSTSGCALTTESKPQPKPSGLQLPGRGRFGLKAPSVVVFSAESGHSQLNNKPTGLSGVRTRSSLLPGFAQKHASSDALPLAKRKRTDMQDKPSCAEAPASSKPGDRVQRPVTVPKDIKTKKPNTDCENCTLLQETLTTFHQELGEFLGRIPSSCENWLPFQRKLEMCLEEFKRLQTEHK